MTNRKVKQKAAELEEQFGAKAKDAAQMVLDNIPMYLGELNPNWCFWSRIKNEIEENEID